MIRKLTVKDTLLLRELFGEEIVQAPINWSLSGICLNDGNWAVENVIVVTNSDYPKALENDEFDVFRIAYIYNRNDDYRLLQRNYIALSIVRNLSVTFGLIFPMRVFAGILI